MPLSQSSIYGLGLFVESDIVSLSRQLLVDRGYLHDLTTGARHQLQPLAAVALQPLERGILFHRWLVYMLDEQLSLDEIGEIISFLNSIGALEVRGHWRRHWRIWLQRLRLLLHGLRPIYLGQRYPPLASNLAWATAAGCAPIWLLSLPLAGLLFASGLVDNRTIILYNLVFNGLLGVTTFVHEWVHLSLIRRRGEPAAILRRGLRLGILHRRLPPRQEILTSVAGPLLGAGVAILLAVGLTQMVNSSLVVATGGLIALFHLCSWLPFYGDGRALINNLRPRRRDV